MEKDVTYERQRHARMNADDPAPVPSMTENVIYARRKPIRDSIPHFA
jgi:hypothetical protein